MHVHTLKMTQFPMMLDIRFKLAVYIFCGWLVDSRRVVVYKKSSAAAELRSRRRFLEGRRRSQYNNNDKKKKSPEQDGDGIPGMGNGIIREGVDFPGRP